MLLRLLPDSPAGSQFTVINGTIATGYTVTNEIDWGNVVWQHAQSGPRGTQGARPAVGVPDNRIVSIPIHIGPTGTVDSCNLKAALLCEAVDDLRRFGGSILWQATGQTPRQSFEVMSAGITKETWGRKGAIVDTAECVLVAQCAPYMLGDPMDTRDAFDTNTIADYTFDIANTGAGALSVASGLLIPGATGTKRIRHTAKGYVYGDVQVTVKVTTGGTLTNGVWGVTRADTAGADTLIAAEIVAGTNVLRLRKYVAGTPTDLITTAFTPIASTAYWVRLRIEGNVLSAWVYTAPPNLSSVAATSTAVNLSTADASRFATGHAGLRITAADTAERYDDFTIEPFTYASISGPEQIRLTGPIPGDVPAQVDATISPVSGNPAPIWGMAGWLERPIVSNMCWNGDFEDVTIGAGGWSAAAVSGVIGAGSSVSRITTAGRVKYGAAAGQIVTPATTDTGASFAIKRRFKAGRTYVVLVWASSTSQTTASRVKLGVSGDVATGTAANLSTTPKIYSAVWTPTGSVVTAYVAFGVNAATATTIGIDGVCVVEVPTIALSAAQGSTTSTAFSVYNTPSDTPNMLPDGTLGAPFLALIDQEIIRVTAITLGAWTGDRAQEGSTAATHAQDAAVAILPPLRPHLEGKGAFPPFGVIAAEDYVAAISGSGLTITTTALTRTGNVLRWTPGTSGPQSTTVVYFVDPNCLVPDDYTLGEIDVEVWIREAWTTSLTSPRVTLSAQPEGGATFGPEKFTREWASTGKRLWPAAAKVMRFHRLGAIPMIVDRANPQRWRLKLTLEATGGASPTWDLDYLAFTATRARLASPTGEQNDTASPAGAFPAFVPYDAAWTTGSRMSKTIRSDGSATIAAPGGYGYPDAGMGGALLEVPDGDCDFIVKCSITVPDDPTLDASADDNATLFHDLHLAVTPRYVLARSS